MADVLSLVRGGYALSILAVAIVVVVILILGALIGMFVIGMFLPLVKLVNYLR